MPGDLSANKRGSVFDSKENLRQYVDRIFGAITTSGARCPTVMCDIFFSLRECAVMHFQGNLLLFTIMDEDENHGDWGERINPCYSRSTAFYHSSVSPGSDVQVQLWSLFLCAI